MADHASTDNRLQTVPDNGSSVSAVTKRSKGIFGFVARWAVHRSDTWTSLIHWNSHDSVPNANSRDNRCLLR